jgi:hypothetical protein
MLFCQFLLGSLLVAGWTSRLAQRAMLKRWWKLSRHGASKAGFGEFLAAHELTASHLHWPNWFLDQDWRRATDRADAPNLIVHYLRILRGAIFSIWTNLRLGLQVVANTCVLVLPAGLLWWFGWYDGWNNSFNKGYEQAAAGPVISIIGIAWFVAAMFYVPMAQARQSATGQWRSFYQFRLIWGIARSKWLSSIGLAVLYCGFGVLLSILKTGPEFWPQGKPLLEGWGPAETKKALGDYFFWCALAMLPAFVILRLAAARIYASGLLLQLQAGLIKPVELSEIERDAVERLGLLQVRQAPERHLFVRFIAWSGTKVARIVAGFILTLIWFGFVAEIYISEFFNYHGARGWLNQPLIQAPWFHYLPSRIQDNGGELFLVVLAFGAFWIMRAIGKAFRVSSN